MIPLSVPEIKGNEWKYIKECLDTNWVSSSGNYVELFEKRFSEYIGAEKAVVTVNGTAALHLALISLGIHEGDEIIVSSLTFIATVNAIRYVGAIPVFVDICRDTFVMDAKKVDKLVTDRTKAIMPVHVYGHPVDMDIIMDIARRHHLYVIEDATESLGSKYKGRNTGTIGHVGCFSFNGNKLITTGGGGMLVTNDKAVGDKVKYLSCQAKTVLENGGFDHEEVGYNYRMPNLLAALGVAQMESIGQFIYAKRSNAAFYSELLKTIVGITLPVEKPWAENVHWLYSVVVEKNFPLSRDEIIIILKHNDIEARPFFTPVHMMKPYKDFPHGNMEITNELAEKGMNLPSSVSLSKDQIKEIADIISNV